MLHTLWHSTFWIKTQQPCITLPTVHTHTHFAIHCNFSGLHNNSTIEKLQFSPIWGLMMKSKMKKEPSANRWMVRMMHGYFATHFIYAAVLNLFMCGIAFCSFFSLSLSLVVCSLRFRVSSRYSCDFSQPHIKHLWTNQLPWCWYSAMENGKFSAFSVVLTT